ncbi:putative DNA-binding protein [Bacillaceae bacterium]
MLEKTHRMNLLYDFYHPLLKDKQKRYMEMYYREDLSLAEIAEVCGVSRQAVFDQIKRVENMLEQWEAKLQLLRKYEQRQAILAEMERLITRLKELD